MDLEKYNLQVQSEVKYEYMILTIGIGLLHIFEIW